MLNLRKVFGAKPKKHEVVQLQELLTPWGEAFDAQHVLEEHPTPQFMRNEYQVLNGVWECIFVPNGHDPQDDLASIVAHAVVPDRVLVGEKTESARGINTGLPQDGWREIVVPFSPEAPLSGVKRQLLPHELLWYKRTFAKPPLEQNRRCVLHFQAVDYACAVRVNGMLAGVHKGGYTPFSFDITEFLELGNNVLEVCVADPSEHGGQPRGKQRIDRGDIWYTAQSGIWQTVWLEVVPETYIEKIQVSADAASSIIVVGVTIKGLEHDQNTSVHLEVFDASDVLVASGEAVTNNGTGAVGAYVANAHLWSPQDPFLYRLKITYHDDTVQSYCAFRTIEMSKDEAGYKRVFLNGKPLFLRGVLDQAYWPDGLMTAPSDEALVYDINAMRNAGFNLMRKHLKVECARWYWHCDRLGMLVLQDMVQGGCAELRAWDWSYKPTLFKFSWTHFRDDTPLHRSALGAGRQDYRDEWIQQCCETVQLLSGHPCIIGWSLFNEGWGQFDACKACEMVQHLDTSRLIDAVSGWYDQGCGDFWSVHNYFRDLSVWHDHFKRAFFVSEFGGLSHHVEGHSSLSECYGYEVFKDPDAWRAAVRKLLAHMDSLNAHGLAGYIYTQVSDIEEETNGLLTYDRRVVKINLA